MKKIYPLIISLIGCCAPVKPVRETPARTIPERYTSAEYKIVPDTSSAIEEIVAELQPAVGKAKCRKITYYNIDSMKNEERKVYKLQEPVVKIPLYNADAIISLRDIYQDGNLDLEIRILPKERKVKMKVYRDLSPFDSLDEVDECEIKWDTAERIAYYPCERIKIDQKEKRSFSNIVNRIAGNLENKAAPFDADHQYAESKYILERSEAVMHMFEFESPYR